MPTFRDLTGSRFGRLVAISCTRVGGRARWLCRCDCGNEKLIDARALGRALEPTRSCGCIAKEVKRTERANPAFKHGHAVDGRRSRALNIWTTMHQRCENQHNKSFQHYGGRGISVCERWNDFAAFLGDMGEPAPGMSIERVDNSKGYSPENCVWATTKQQSRNRRVNRSIEIGGVRLPLVDWCERKGLNYYTVHSRITKLGWAPERALGMV